jgi:hypothetical protein
MKCDTQQDGRALLCFRDFYIRDYYVNPELGFSRSGKVRGAMLSVTNIPLCSVLLCCMSYAECHKEALNAQCCIAEYLMLHVTKKPLMLSVIMLNVSC